jgi:hypothetical protein
VFGTGQGTGLGVHGIGHNLPQQDPQAFTPAVVDVLNRQT